MDNHQPKANANRGGGKPGDQPEGSKYKPKVPRGPRDAPKELVDMDPHQLGVFNKWKGVKEDLSKETARNKEALDKKGLPHFMQNLAEPEMAAASCQVVKQPHGAQSPGAAGLTELVTTGVASPTTQLRKFEMPPRPKSRQPRVQTHRAQTGKIATPSDHTGAPTTVEAINDLLSGIILADASSGPTTSSGPGEGRTATDASVSPWNGQAPRMPMIYPWFPDNPSMQMMPRQGPAMNGYGFQRAHGMYSQIGDNTSGSMYGQVSHMDGHLGPNHFRTSPQFPGNDGSGSPMGASTPFIPGPTVFNQAQAMNKNISTVRARGSANPVPRHARASTRDSIPVAPVSSPLLSVDRPIRPPTPTVSNLDVSVSKEWKSLVEGCRKHNLLENLAHLGAKINILYAPKDLRHVRQERRIQDLHMAGGSPNGEPVLFNLHEEWKTVPTLNDILTKLQPWGGKTHGSRSIQLGLSLRNGAWCQPQALSNKDWDRDQSLLYDAFPQASVMDITVQGDAQWVFAVRCVKGNPNSSAWVIMWPPPARDSPFWPAYVNRICTNWTPGQTTQLLQQFGRELSGPFIARLQGTDAVHIPCGWLYTVFNTSMDTVLGRQRISPANRTDISNSVTVFGQLLRAWNKATEEGDTPPEIHAWFKTILNGLSAERQHGQREQEIAEFVNLLRSLSLPGTRVRNFLEHQVSTLWRHLQNWRTRDDPWEELTPLKT